MKRVQRAAFAEKQKLADPHDISSNRHDFCAKPYACAGFRRAHQVSAAHSLE
jgi:hypothetical protein